MDTQMLIEVGYWFLIVAAVALLFWITIKLIGGVLNLLIMVVSLVRLTWGLLIRMVVFVVGILTAGFGTLLVLIRRRSA